MKNIARFRNFTISFTKLIEQAGHDEIYIFKDGKSLLKELISHDDWLPNEFAKPHPDHYQQYLLHCDPMERFSVVSFVWGPGQTTPIHDHKTWGMIGVMRGAEACEEFDHDPATQCLRLKDSHQLLSGSIDLVSPSIGDIHKVSNAYTDRSSLSIHIYGANIGTAKRHVYDLENRRKSIFVSGYSSRVMPNIWDKTD